MGHFLGIHLSRRNTDYYYCLLDAEMQVRVLEQGHFDEVLSYAAGEDTSVVAVDAPAHINAGLMQREDFRSQFIPAPATNRWMDLRVGEYELVRRRMKISRTPGGKGACPQWIQRGLELHEALRGLGYTPFPAQSDRMIVEVPAEAAFQAMLGAPLLPESSTEGRIQRQLLLWRLGVQIDDPMQAFEEVTRYKLERGKFPFSNICSCGQLLAIAAAFVAWLCEKRPEEVQAYGREEEGVITLPLQLIHS